MCDYVIVCVCAWRPLIPIEVATASIVRGGCSLEPMTPTITLFALPSLATTSPPEIFLPKKEIVVVGFNVLRRVAERSQRCSLKDQGSNPYLGELFQKTKCNSAIFHCLV